jgi:hypothetical protein
VTGGRTEACFGGHPGKATFNLGPGDLKMEVETISNHYVFKYKNHYTMEVRQNNYTSL